MKRIFISLFIVLTSHCSYAQGWQWSKSLGGPGDDGLNNIAVDNDGNLYVSGGVNSPYTIVGTDTLSPVGGGDFYIAKYDSSGNFLWSKQFGGNSDEGGGAIEFDSATNSLYIYGIIGTATIDGITLNCNAQDLFIAKFDLNGICLWAKNFGSVYNDIMRGFGTFDIASGLIYLTGKMLDSAYIGSNLLPPGEFLAAYDINGNYIWAKNISSVKGTPGNYTTDFALLSVNAKANALFIMGSTGGDTFSIDGYTLVGLPNAGYMLFSKFDLDGNIINAKLDGPGFSGVSRTDLDSESNIYIAGMFSDSAFINDSLITDSGYEILIAKYDSSFNSLWVRQLYATGGYISNIIVDSETNFYATGKFYGSAIFGSYTITSASATGNLFLTRYDKEGNCLGVDASSGAPGDFGRSLAVYKNDFCYVGGEFYNYSVTSPDTIYSKGWDDVFVAKHAPILVSTQARLVNNSNQLLIYANPNTGKCNITVPDEFSKEENLTLRIFDNSGKLIQEQTVEMYEDKVKVNLEAEAKGIYNVTLSNNPSAGSGRRKKSYAGKIVFE